jgi:hypothetical protein
MSEQTSLEFEREKWLGEHELRKREVEIKERDASRSRWSSPLIVALLAAALAAIGNAATIWFNGREQRKLEITKAEHVRILEMIKTDNKQAAENLKFLTDSGLISDDDLKRRIQAFLATGRSPALPPPLVPVPPISSIDWNPPLPPRPGDPPFTDRNEPDREGPPPPRSRR